MNDNYFKFSPSVILLPFSFVLLLWVTFWFQIRYGIDAYELGIYPRTFTGLRGVLFSPFLHGDIGHLYNNSIPLLILVAALRYFYREQFFNVMLYGLLISGILTWIIARQSYHIGASGLIYVLVSFIIFKGIRTKYYRLVALSLAVVMIYGGLVWYVFPDVEPGISWEGHLAGLITGFAFSLYYKTPDYKKEIRYEWERPDYNPESDKFMQRFDENGNFVNPPPPPEPVEEPELLRIVYNYIPEKDPSGTMPETHQERDGDGVRNKHGNT